MYVYAYVHLVVDGESERLALSLRERREVSPPTPTLSLSFQMYSYLRTQERESDAPSLSAEGILLHPQTGGYVNEMMMVQGHEISFRTIDLTASASIFERQLRLLDTAKAG